MNYLSLSLAMIGCCSLSAQDSSQIPLGLEAVTGARSEYVYRGFKHAQQILDFQIEGEITIDDGYYLGYGAWYGTGTGNDDFSESGVKLTLTYDIDSWQWYNGLKYRDLNESTFDSGVEVTSRLSYFLSESEQHSNELSGIVSYDSGAEGIYGAVEFSSYRALSDSSYLSFKAGASFTESYYDTSGANDFYSRVSFTYNLTEQVSISPFVFTSINLADDDRSDYLGAGVWFEISF